MFVESGLYEHLYKIGLNPKRIGPDQGEKIVYHDINFININLGQLYGIFILLILMEILSLIIYFIEIFAINIKEKFCMIISYSENKVLKFLHKMRVIAVILILINLN